MFKKFFSRNQTTTVPGRWNQHTIDNMRVIYAADNAMQLHLDRMQSSLNAR